MYVCVCRMLRTQHAATIEDQGPDRAFQDRVCQSVVIFVRSVILRPLTTLQSGILAAVFVLGYSRC